MPPSGQTPAAASRRRPSPRTIVGAVLVVLLVLFAALNSQTVTVHLLVGTTEVALIVVIAACGLGGFAVGWLLARRHARRRRAR